MLPARRDVDLNSLLNVLLPRDSSEGRRDAMPSPRALRPKIEPAAAPA
jgi:hypothetical protein